MNVEYFTLSAHNISASFAAMFQIATERDLNFGVLSCHPLGETAKEKIKALLEAKEVRNAAVSVGVGRIDGKGFKFSPKLPYISEDGIIVNVKRCEELKIPDYLQNIREMRKRDDSREFALYSHFEDAGGIHATLLSFLEAVVPYGELYSYPYESNSQHLSRWEWMAHEALHRLKGAFSNVSYEIQKKYDNDQT